MMSSWAGDEIAATTEGDQGGSPKHGLAAVAADAWVVVPNFADESGPRAPPLAEELWFHLSFGVCGAGGRCAGDRRRRDA